MSCNYGSCQSCCLFAIRKSPEFSKASCQWNCFNRRGSTFSPCAFYRLLQARLRSDLIGFAQPRTKMNCNSHSAQSNSAGDLPKSPSMHDISDDVVGEICTFMALKDITLFGITCHYFREKAAQCRLTVDATDIEEMFNCALWNASTKIRIFDYRPERNIQRDDDVLMKKSLRVHYLLRYIREVVLQSTILEKLVMTWPKLFGISREPLITQMISSDFTYPYLTELSLVDPLNANVMYLTDDEIEALVSRASNLKHLSCAPLSCTSIWIDPPQLESLFISSGSSHHDNAPICELLSVQTMHFLGIGNRNHLKITPNIHTLRSNVLCWNQQYVEELERMTHLTNIELYISEWGAMLRGFLNHPLLADYAAKDYRRVFNLIRSLHFNNVHMNSILDVIAGIVPLIIEVSEDHFKTDSLHLEVTLSRLDYAKDLMSRTKLLMEKVQDIGCQMTLKVVLDCRQFDPTDILRSLNGNVNPKTKTWSLQEKKWTLTFL